ncbi:MAG: response regulator transcription factor, partial [Chloroflexota bacterium]|nr:response regulator transcription factor [Chloroflexota bacterium]
MSDITVLIVDDNPVIRQGLKSLLDAEDGIAVVGEASTGVEAIQWVKRHSTDVILMDIRMPVIDGIGATTEILRLKSEVKILILTVTEDPTTLARSIYSGAKGYLVYSRFSPDELVDAVHTVASGKSLPPSPVVALAVEDMPEEEARSWFLEEQQLRDPLTMREGEILDLIAEGRSNAEIA